MADSKTNPRGQSRPRDGGGGGWECRVVSLVIGYEKEKPGDT